MKIKNILLIIVMIIGVFTISGCNKKEESKISIIATNYPAYDFTRAIVKDSNVNVKMLLKPGASMHDYEPTPKDIIDITNSDIFVYVGGESDEWIDGILKDIDLNKTKVIKLMDLVDVKEEEIVDGMEAEEEEEEEGEVEYDEHIWTSPKNAITIINKLKEDIIKLDDSKKELFNNNASSYIEKLNKIDGAIRNVVNNAKRKEVIFGDRFPLRYLVDEYNLKYYAAFPGCSEETEASAKTISFLIKKVKEDNIPVVFHIELSSTKIADTIASNTNAKVLEFNAAHNISQEDFDAGLTYVDIMNKNIEVLKEALN